MHGGLIRVKTEHDKLCPIVANEEIEICTNCDLPAKDCEKMKCDRFDKLMNELREKKRDGRCAKAKVD